MLKMATNIQWSPVQANGLLWPCIGNSVASITAVLQRTAQVRREHCTGKIQSRSGLSVIPVSITFGPALTALGSTKAAVTDPGDDHYALFLLYPKDFTESRISKRCLPFYAYCFSIHNTKVMETTQTLQKRTAEQTYYDSDTSDQIPPEESYLATETNPVITRKGFTDVLWSAQHTPTAKGNSGSLSVLTAITCCNIWRSF
ncbi:PREDICTED: uncharacterized protein LOC106147815 isoform X1 [Chinchilla lanigera]|uniref:uncharacterized protein LOC106147815 isoform X1 n=1 Tax=Chinchilla lanigera TaxID=34839 RepID=UPI0006971250|nr:PREDICTED: uncharacterized protein LOC106147815 isoform X1 [Chinchilla lanigera]XP_013366180.1 PREDICTED: uncharacterized protein LOC106147815 isoform X1 [Chinchilla lanigera]XP_013366181.1 PREDICTED: uncharacterized protein LOC106147815 isoform X1 [Chinchilla lanigera]XP_013366182.1 PREDICTED: uncharacterized protein LOC106147815 isoform X1 [Chinchilla lanigera]XP_013366183.1 PREDICTED: uncharacterized protein LOC106147815 isoform X1 [Chinchilla lanigera]XP_013366184.1 PREDICTED: uncharact